MSRFNMLLQREWMQHHRGWLILMLAPPLLILLLLPFAQVEFGPGELGPLPPVGLMLGAMAVVPLLVLGITTAALLFQTPGLARRDRQDRSIEFWLSLPTSHSSSIGATVLAHLVLVPLAAVAIGALFSHVIGFGVVWKVFGLSDALALPWGTLIVVGFAGLIRALLGVLLACLWLMPLLLLTMAASAWLKRWGLPVLVIGFALANQLLSRMYGITMIGDTFRGLLVNARLALIHDMPQRVHGPQAALDWLANAPGWFLTGGLAALRDLAQPLFVFALLASAACFGLLVLRRRRNG